MATQAAASHQQSQTGLAMAMAPSLGAAWGSLDVSHLSTTLPHFTALIAAIVHRFSPASATLAARYYEAERRAAGISSPFRPRPATSAPLEQISKTVSWATQPLWSPDVTATEVEQARKNIDGAVERLVLNTGRLTVAEAVQQDKQARGWARVPEPGCCSFCALLATRGAVYKSEATAGGNANKRFTGAGEFKFHNNCRCHIEPTFTHYEPTAQVREWQALYQDATSGVHGMNNLLNAWRRAFEANA